MKSEIVIKKGVQMSINVSSYFKEACQVAADQDNTSLNEYVRGVLKADLEKRGIQINVFAQIDQDPAKFAEYEKLMNEFVKGAKSKGSMFSNQQEVSQADYEKSMSVFVEKAKQGRKLFQE